VGASTSDNTVDLHGLSQLYLIEAIDPNNKAVSLIPYLKATDNFCEKVCLRIVEGYDPSDMYGII
jgi:hypothetical protein